MQKYDNSPEFTSGSRKKRLRICAIRLVLLLLLPVGAGAENAGFGRVVFSEILSDPEPVVGLPKVEYVELCNRTDRMVDLAGWTFWYDSRPFPLPAFTLQGGAYVILCGNGGVGRFDSGVDVLALPTFPLMARSGKILCLTAGDGTLVSAVSYSDGWYEDAFKRKGGWSLECVDVDNLSGDGSNWKASTDSLGGTPGRKNAVSAVNPDVSVPSCSHLSVPTPSTVVLRFSKRMDAGWLSDATKYKLAGDGLSIAGVKPLYPLYREAELLLNRSVRAGDVHTLRLVAPRDVSGNVSADTAFRIGLPVKPDVFDLSINELLFNPKEGDGDYVEVVNRSPRCLDLSQVWLCGRDEDGTLQEGCRLSEDPVPVFSGSYWVFSADGAGLAKQYACDSLSHFPSLSGFPSMPDKSGAVVLVTTGNQVIDECDYSSGWHMPLIRDEEGVALEKVQPDKPSGEADSWMSASSLCGYGTPGRRNSQYADPLATTDAFLSVDRGWLTPNGDGREDLLTVGLTVKEPGTVSLTLFDLKGIAVCHWLRNQWVGANQEINWNGTDDNGSLLPLGRYILFATVTRINGKIQTAKTVVTVL